MAARKIWEKDWRYSFLKRICDRCTKLGYSRTEVVGYENIPSDGAVIIAPNHCNTLMDALVVLRAFPDQTVFGARASIFNNKTVGAFMRFIRILPMVRARDGLMNVLKNKESQEEIVDTLANGVRYCMYCEGSHRTKHSLMPCSKGIIRFALSAVEKCGDSKPVYIVPTGLEYGDYFRYRSTSLVNFGKPINVTAFLAEHKDLGESEIYRRLRELLTSKISELITYLPDDESYDARWALLKARTAPLRGNLVERLEHNQRVAKLPASDGQLASALAFEAHRRKAGISSHAFGAGMLLPKSLLWLLWLPFFLASAVLMLPAWLAAELFCKFKTRDKAFCNTVRFVFRFFGALLLIPLVAIISFCNLPAYAACIVTLFSAFSFSNVYDFANFSRVLLSQWKLLFNKPLVAEWRELTCSQTVD